LKGCVDETSACAALIN